MKVSIVIPTYNEEECIARTIKEIPKNAIDEIIIVDISTDKTAEIARKLGCKVYRQKGVVGLGGAFRQGAEHASGDVMIFMGAGGNHNPKDIPKLLKKLKEGYDSVLFSRYTLESYSEDDTMLRSFGNWFITTLVNLLFHINTTDSLYNFVAIRKKAHDKLKLRSDGFDYCIEILVKSFAHRLKMAELPSIERKRFAGQSKVQDFKHGFQIIMSIFLWRYRLSKLLKIRSYEMKKMLNKGFVRR